MARWNSKLVNRRVRAVGDQRVVRRLAGSWWRDAATPERKARSRLELVASIAALAVFASACAHGFRAPNSRVGNWGDSGKPRHFVVLPVNLTIKAQPEFGPLLDDMFGVSVSAFKTTRASPPLNK